MLRDADLILRPADNSEADKIWHLIFDDMQWKQFDAPYYPLARQSLSEFTSGMLPRFVTGETAFLIEVAGQVVGSVSYHWEDKNTRWLEVGIAIYTANHWGKHMGRRALALWINHLFQQHDVARIGLTTWSGNPRMVASAEAIGLKVEGCLRKVRYFNGEYYDSIKMGVLREEWSLEAV
ncbi:MAG: GNAT family N-acetyltransferase [Pseudomonadales bacterium]